MAAISKTKIANMALHHVGANTQIEDLDEQSSNAKVCKLWYDHARQQVLEGYNWTFARRRLTLAEHSEDPPDEWAYRYQYPAGALKIRELPSGLRDQSDPIPFEVELNEDGDQKTILTDMDEASAIYTSDIETTALFSPHFVITLSYLLAHYIAPKITSKTQKTQEMYQQYLRCLAVAPSMDANESAKGPPREAEWVRGRD